MQGAEAAGPTSQALGGIGGFETHPYGLAGVLTTKWYRMPMTDSRVRVFIAVDLPDAVKLGLGKVIASIDRLEIRSVRTVRTEGLHLTLSFLGDVDVGDIPKVMSAMETAAAESEVMDLVLAGTGAFPNIMAPRTLWAGVKGELDKLSALQGRIEKALESAGLRQRKERFSPHVTIARIRNRMSAAQLEVVNAALEEAPQSPIAFRAGSIILMRSTPRQGGSVYTPMHIAMLGAGREMPSVQ